MSDRIFGGIGLVLAIIYAWAAAGIQESFLTDEVGPKVFPWIIAVILGLSSVWFLLKPDPDPEWPSWGRIAEIGLAALVLAIYAEALPVFGFLLPTALASAYLTWRLGSRPLESVVIGVLTALGIYLIFRSLLGLSLPREGVELAIDAFFSTIGDLFGNEPAPATAPQGD
ncbi:tripartite tricarboxylate transporter TctB family protein [Palleronia pelagia]|uniref:Putative tricarboxylic transport membrane protein n=1 Tax=Palleronia pelagia TaxID=387096 RepID=A0A1H8BDF8_9RHOB|nr:tripartite tricarboxylate transporter TctB family protein [Palleronia pelagia]SEM80038.1 putative tricarboxylic transport membrane protein [Palleronia pelagia]